MSRPTRTLSDGSHWYACGHGYTPVAPSERRYDSHRPDDPRAVRYGNNWFLPLEVLEDSRRSMPETVPDAETLSHPASCRCDVCRRPQATALWRRASRRGTTS